MTLVVARCSLDVQQQLKCIGCNFFSCTEAAVIIPYLR